MNGCLAAPAEPCSVTFWDFAGSVIVGSAGARLAQWATKKAYNEGGSSSEQTAAMFTGLAAFWVFGGLTWVALSRRRA